MEDYAIVSRKTEEQLRKFLGGFSPHPSKPRLKFLGDMLYGVQAAGDVKLSEIARELRPGSGCSPKKKEERLSRHLAAEDLTGVMAVASTCTTMAGTTRSCSASTASWAWTSSSSRRRISPASGWDGA